MDLNYYMIIITNLCIGITFLFSIILIIDELYNVGFFTFNYTYYYNYGSFMSKFNTNQTIECETNRYNVYNNINFLFKDIYNKSYFNYLITIVIIIITILFSIAYGVYFYFRFIIEQPKLCSFEIETDLSLPKQILKCLCDECHKIIPNCTSNYLIVFILIIIIPLSYILKVFLNINITPNTDNYLFSFMYLCVFILLLFYFSFSLYNRKTDNKYKDLIIYFFFTILFISSGYIYKYIISKYNNINLNTSYNISTMYDIYKQSPPIKPTPIQKPTYKGIDLLLSFKYDDKNTDPEYMIKKTIVDKYYKDIKNYDNDMKYYNQRFNAYTSSSLNPTTFSDKTDYLDIAINILGFNNNMHIYIIILTIIAYIIYSIYKDDTSYICFIYLLTILISITIMNSILYYNTYVNKYIIYEPMAHYKNDITNANTALNLELDAESGIGFYNKLINNANTKSDTSGKNAKQIFADIKTLLTLKNYTLAKTKEINTAIIDLNQNKFTNISSNKNNQKIDTIIYYKKVSGDLNPLNATDKSIIYLLTNCVSSINTVSKNDIKIEPAKTLTLTFDSMKASTYTIILAMSEYYKYVYYKAYQYLKILEKLKETNEDYINKNFYIEYLELQDKLNNIITSLNNYKLATKPMDIDATYKTAITEDIKKFTESKSNLIKIHIISIYNDIKGKIEKFREEYLGYKIDFNIITLINKSTKYSEIKKLKLNINTITEDSQFIGDAVPGLTSKNLYTISANDIITDVDTLYNILPNKINDANNDEYCFILNENNKIRIIVNYPIPADDTINNYKIISINNNVAFSLEKLASNYYYSDLIGATNIAIPFNFYNYTSNNTNKFSNIIKAVLLNDICNIQSSFPNVNLLNKIKRFEEAANIKIFKYYDYFNSTSINTFNYIEYDGSALNSNNTLLSIPMGSNSNIISYIILLYNAYKAESFDIKPEIHNKIKYLIYNNKKYFNNSDIATTLYLEKIVTGKILLNINAEKTDETDDEYFRLYNNNLHIINIIIKLYENLLLTIKAEIGKNESRLCLPSKSTLSEIETKIYDMYFTSPTSYATINAPAALNTVSVIKTKLAVTDSDAKSIKAINEHYIYFNNIVKFLLDNLKLDNNSSTIATITSNYNFYNKEEIIKEPIRKQLIINCDYGSKYNKLDTKQLSYFKINADNVSYNFPILMVIFLIVLGEPAFIKS